MIVEESKAHKTDCVVSLVKTPDEGGQTVGVRVMHTPTGLVAECGYERSQHRNREVAFLMIERGLVAMNWPRTIA